MINPIHHKLRKPGPAYKLVFIAVLALLLAGCGGGMPANSWAGLTVKDGFAYMAATDKVVAVDVTNGQVRWTFKPEITQTNLLGSGKSQVPAHAEPALDGGLVFIGTDGQPTDQGGVRAVDIDSGQQRWQFPPDGQSPLGNIFAGLVTQEGTVYFAAGDTRDRAKRLLGDHVFALEAATGKELWQTSVGGRVWGTPVLAGDRLYVSTLNHKLLALDIANQGKVIWEFGEAKGAIAGSPVLDGDTLYVGALDDKLYALDARTGQKQWSYELKGWLWDGLTVVSHTLYVGDMAGYVQALAVDGEPPRALWGQPIKLDSAVRANPFYAHQAAVLIVGTENGNVYALDPDSGAVRWVARAPGGRFLTRPSLEGGVLLLPTLSGDVRLYGLDLAAMPAAYQQQEVKNGERQPVALYKEGTVNAQVVRWHLLAQSK